MKSVITLLEEQLRADIEAAYKEESKLIYGGGFKMSNDDHLRSERAGMVRMEEPDSVEMKVKLGQEAMADMLEEELEGTVVHPPYYTKWKAMEPFTFLMLNQVPFDAGCVCKYVLRWRDKNGIQDLQKAKRVIEMMIELETHREKYLPEVSAL